MKMIPRYSRNARSNRRAGSLPASRTKTTYERLRAFVEELKTEAPAAPRCTHPPSKRSEFALGQLWEQSGCPTDRDLEFWFQAEAEISERERQ